MYPEVYEKVSQLLENSQPLDHFGFPVEYKSFVKEEEGEKKIYYLFMIDGLPYWVTQTLAPEGTSNPRTEAEAVFHHVKTHLARETTLVAFGLVNEALRDFHRDEEGAYSEQQWKKGLKKDTLDSFDYRAESLQKHRQWVQGQKHTDLFLLYCHRRKMFSQIRRECKASYDNYCNSHHTHSISKWSNEVWKAEVKTKYSPRVADIAFRFATDPGLTPKDAALTYLSHITGYSPDYLDRYILRDVSRKWTNRARKQP